MKNTIFAVVSKNKLKVQLKSMKNKMNYGQTNIIKILESKPPVSLLKISWKYTA